MIKFQKVKLQNFFSFREGEIDLSSYRGPVLISAQNGAGKSTIIEAILWALTGNTIKNVPVVDIVNREEGKDCCVEVHFQVDDQEYTVWRYRDHSKYHNSLYIYHDNTDISPRTSTQTQKVIDDILGVGYQVLINTVIIGEGMINRFTALNDRSQKDLIASTLTLRCDTDKCTEIMKSKISELKMEQIKSQATRDTLVRSLSDLKDVGDLDLSESRKRMDHLKRLIYEERVKLDQLKGSDESLRSAQTSLLNVINDIRHASTLLHNAQSDYQTLVSELQTFNNQVSLKCPMCHHDLQDKTIVLQSYQQKITAVCARVNQYQAELDAAHILQLNDNLERYRWDDKDIEAKYQCVTDQLKSIASDVICLSAEYRDHSAELSSIEAKIKICEDAEAKIDRLSNDLAVLDNEITDREHELNLHDEALSIFKPTGLKTYMLESALGYLNQRLSTYTNVLMSRSYEMQLVKGKLVLRDEDGMSYRSLSSGEKKRLDCSIQFALSDYVSEYCGMKTNTIFLDEIFENLDAEGIENVVQLLKLKQEYLGLDSLFVITHTDMLKEKFDQIIKIYKDDHGSHIL